MGGPVVEEVVVFFLLWIEMQPLVLASHHQQHALLFLSRLNRAASRWRQSPVDNRIQKGIPSFSLPHDYPVPFWLYVAKAAKVTVWPRDGIFDFSSSDSKK